MRYFTSDTHYGHQNIIEFCDRPYADVHHMNVDLVNRAASTLTMEDELWHLGDVALGYLDDTLANLARIAVDVTLVAGNHDRCHPYNGTRGERFVDVYRERCQLRELILTNTTLTLSNGAEVNVSHFPYADPQLDGKEDRHGRVIGDKFAPWRAVDDGSWLLCGHVHESWRQRGRMINVGVDAWGGNPVSEDTIVELIEAGSRDLARLAWGSGR
ncbi:MAG: metallophosphoesterase [Aeromicrobium sp.]|nr:metallophosphoesterase [Aeromicrobium sp.]